MYSNIVDRLGWRTPIIAGGLPLFDARKWLPRG
jgi:hypothetical protein